MEISRVISIFEQCIPVYQKAVDNKYNYHMLRDIKMNNGICGFVAKRLGVHICEDFIYHYKNHIAFNYLFPTPFDLWLIDYESVIIEICILPRLNFLKTEVKRLKKLQQKGYTHI